ncbi:MAG TPA: VOC family protein [Candidatus Krumholzibacteria bacterium]|nr:VOC family protein [Candidatus Krumholzibacteria bacterium]
MNRIVHFEIPADNPERATAFYAKALGWEFSKYPGDMPYWLVKTGADGVPGIDGGLMPRQHPGQGPVLVAGVESVDTTTANITKAGGVSVAPKMAIPGVGWAAYFTDPEGNVFGIFQNDPGAK